MAILATFYKTGYFLQLLAILATFWIGAIFVNFINMAVLGTFEIVGDYGYFCCERKKNLEKSRIYFSSNWVNFLWSRRRSFYDT